MKNFITNHNTANLKKRLIELIQKSDELKFLVGFFYFSGIRELYEGLKEKSDVNIKVLVETPDKQAKVHDLEKQIDQMVYKLYDLTPEEIVIVEGKKRNQSNYRDTQRNSSFLEERQRMKSLRLSRHHHGNLPNWDGWYAKKVLFLKMNGIRSIIRLNR